MSRDIAFRFLIITPFLQCFIQKPAFQASEMSKKSNIDLLEAKFELWLIFWLR